MSDRLCAGLRSSLEHGSGLLAQVPAVVARLIEDDLWQVREPVNDQPGYFSRWDDFVRAKPRAGLGQDPARVVAVCKGHLEAEAALARVMGAGHGGDRTSDGSKVYNIHLAKGTARSRALRRLQEQRPDLFERVKAGELSPHRACIEAGWRSRMASIPVDDAAGIARVLKRQCSKAVLRAVLQAMRRRLGKARA